MTSEPLEEGETCKLEHILRKCSNQNYLEMLLVSARNNFLRELISLTGVFCETMSSFLTSMIGYILAFFILKPGHPLMSFVF